MELRYCEECGNPVRVDRGQAFGLTDRFVCEECLEGRAESRSVKDSGPRGEKLEGLLEGSGLNLFSQQTIAFHKQKQETTTGPQKPKSSRLRLVKPGSSSTPAGGAMGAGESSHNSSGEPVPSPTASTVQPPHSPPASSPPSAGSGSSAPARSAQRILFRCLHCRSTLSIRPVGRTSKLVCPHCAQEIFVTSSGRLLKSSPSAAIRKEDLASEVAVAPTSRSVRIVKPGSTDHSKPARTPDAAAEEVLLPSVPQTAPQATVPSTPSRPGSVRVPAVRPGSARVSEPRPGSVRVTTAKPASVRLTRVHPGIPAAKPCSAFEEHQARQDPEKTIFITEEPTEELSLLASSAVTKAVSEHIYSPRRTPAAPSPGGAGPLLPDESDLLESDPECVAVAAAGAASPQASLSTREKTESPAGKGGLAQRVLKALFTP